MNARQPDDDEPDKLAGPRGIALGLLLTVLVGLFGAGVVKLLRRFWP